MPKHKPSGTIFFNVFGIPRRSVASFERTVRNLSGAHDRIDVIWQGVMLGEHKSRGQDLSKAQSQALGYVQSLTREGRSHEVPRYIVVSDFATIVLHDLEATEPLFESISFPVEDLHQHIRLLDFLNGIQSRPADPEDEINIDAVEVLGTLHDTLEAGGYTGHKVTGWVLPQRLHHDESVVGWTQSCGLHASGNYRGRSVVGVLGKEFDLT